MKLSSRSRPITSRVTIGLVTVVLLILLSKVAHADSVSPDKITNSINVFDTVVVYPSPSWFSEEVDQKDLLNISEYYRNQNGPSFVFEQIPKGEKFESWSEMLAVAGMVSNQMTYDTFFKGTVAVYLASCGRDNFKMQVLGKGNDRMTFLILCEDSPNATMAGYGPGVGEVILMHLSKPYGTWIKVYHNWRGKAFGASDKSTWPVDVVKLNMMIERFKRIEYTKSVLK